MHDSSETSIATSDLVPATSDSRLEVLDRMEECHETLARLMQLDSVLDDMQGRGEVPETPRMTQHDSANFDRDDNDWNAALEAEKTFVRDVIKDIRRSSKMANFEPDEHLVQRLSHANVHRKESVERERQQNINSTGLRTYLDSRSDLDSHSSGSRDTSMLVESKPTFMSNYLDQRSRGHSTIVDRPSVTVLSTSPSTEGPQSISEDSSIFNIQPNRRSLEDQQQVGPILGVDKNRQYISTEGFDDDVMSTDARTDIALTSTDTKSFAAHILKLSPKIQQHMFSRTVTEQERRHQKLLDARNEHDAHVQRHSCPNGDLCGSLGTGPQYPRLSTGHPPVFWIPHGSPPEERPHYAELAAFPNGISLPPASLLPAEFECPLCFQVKKVINPSDWIRHVNEDLQPFTCTCMSQKSFRICRQLYH